jgi:hypothetical protein
MSIFDEKNKVSANWFQKTTVGDKVEGTYISKRKGVNQMSGKEQMIYEIITADGKHTLIGGNGGIDYQMKSVRFGQIVGFEYTGEVPNKNPKLNPVKKVQVYADPSVIDEDWITQQKKLDSIGDEESEVAEETITATETKTETKTEVDANLKDHPFLTESEKRRLLVQIAELAKGKLGANTPEEVKSKSMEATNLAFIDANLASIAGALSQLPERKG